MQRPSVLRAESSGRLARFQRKAARGLKQRLRHLKESWSNDSTSLEEKKSALAREFDEEEVRLANEQAQALHASYEQWDEEIDRWIRTAERETLLSLRSERDSLKKLKQSFTEQKAALKKRREDEIAAVQKQNEQKRSSTSQIRDNLRKRVDAERLALQVDEQELRTWFASTTGRDLQFPSLPLSEDRINAIREAQDLQGALKAIDEQKATIAGKVQAIQDQVKEKNRRRLVLTGIGPVVSLLLAIIAWLAAAPILFVAIIALAGAVILSCAIYFLLGSLIGKSSQGLVPELEMERNVQSEQLNYMLQLVELQYQRELKRLASEQQLALKRIDELYETNSKRMIADFTAKEANLQTSANRRRWELAQSKEKYIESSDTRWQPILDQQTEKFAHDQSKLAADREGEKQNLVNRFLRSQLYCADRWKDGATSIDNWIQPVNEFLDRTQPNWSSSRFSNGEWKRDKQNLVWKLGTSNILAYLSSEAAACNPRLFVEASVWPVVFDLMHHGALILKCDSEVKSQQSFQPNAKASSALNNGASSSNMGGSHADENADEIITNLLLRAATSLPAGIMRFTIIDPQGLGKKYSWLMSLADIDPALVGDRVWTQPVHIADQLANIARSCEDIIQQSLRDTHRTLFDYNEQAGPMAVPYRLVVWDQFPSGLDESSWSSLCSILAAGGRCGVGVILKLAKSFVWPAFADAEYLEQFGLHLVASSERPGEARWNLSEFEHASIELEQPPTAERIKEIMVHHHDHMAQLGRIIVPFETIATSDNELQQATSAVNLQIPIGVSSAGRTHQLRLGEGTAQHVLVAGKTGSGKSSLLHTLITSAALKYGPDQLRLILLDFKKGVEFQVYSETKLSHADVIGIESKREFGVSTLEYVDKIMNARGEVFRAHGVQDVASLNKKNPEIPMPRILIVVDEFQELFVEDDKVSQQATLLMDRIVRQGRSFGVHLVLASQTLGGSYSLPRTTLAQMAVRIALQCDSSDAMLILGEDNTAAERLRFSGQAIYNDAGGRIENNHGFQVAFADKDTLTKSLRRLPTVQPPFDPAINPMGRQIVFEGHRPALWDNGVMKRLLQDSSRTDSVSLPLLLGDSVSIDPPIVASLPRTAGRNVVLVGPDDRMVASCLASLAQGVFFVDGELAAQESGDSQGNDNGTVMSILDGSRHEDAVTRDVIERLRSHSRVSTYGVRELDQLFGEWAAELTKRLEHPHESYPSKLLCVVNLARFRELRKGDEFSFGESDGSEQPDVILANLLKDGPAVGLHVWIWSDSANTLGRWLSRQSMRELELRILMQMSSNDSNQLVDSNAANKLEANLLLFQDEMDGKPIKIRPLAWESMPIFQPRSTNE